MTAEGLERLDTCAKRLGVSRAYLVDALFRAADLGQVCALVQGQKILDAEARADGS